MPPQRVIIYLCNDFYMEHISASVIVQLDKADFYIFVFYYCFGMMGTDFSILGFKNNYDSQA